jgi:hypothetical protein
MSAAADRLAQTRRAIIEQIEGRERGRDWREKRAERRRERAQARGEHEYEPGGRGWLGRLRQAAATWWRHHPAHMGLEIATPMLSSYAQRKPLQYLGIAAATGAVVMIARPWRLLSITGLAMALLKSSQLSSLLMSALSAADFQKDESQP